ncbi:hypothetical protein D3C79_934660 [compost metagenome]
MGQQAAAGLHQLRTMIGDPIAQLAVFFYQSQRFLNHRRYPLRLCQSLLHAVQIIHQINRRRA